MFGQICKQCYLSKLTNLFRKIDNGIFLHKSQTIQHSAMLYDELVSYMDIVNEALYLQMIFAISGIFVYHLFTLFGCYRLMVKFHKKIYLTILARIIWNLVNIFYITLTVYIGNEIKIKVCVLY